MASWLFFVFFKLVTMNSFGFRNVVDTNKAIWRRHSRITMASFVDESSEMMLTAKGSPSHSYHLQVKHAVFANMCSQFLYNMEIN